MLGWSSALLRAALILTIVLLANPAAAGLNCLKMEGPLKQAMTMPASVGEELRLSFRHSIYGSQVEEQFRITEDGLETTELRYSEARLVEFYGYDAARFERGWWIVEGKHRIIPFLDLRVSPESLLQIFLGSEPIFLSPMVDPGGLVRLTVIPCERTIDGRRADN